MNSVPPTVETTWGLLIGIVSLVIGASIGWAVIRSKHGVAEVARTFAKVLVVGVLLLVLGGFVWTTGVPTSPPPQPPVFETSGLLSMTRIESSASENASLPVSSASPTEPAKTGVELPAWIRPAVRIDGQRRLIVVSGGRFATESEAELHGFEAAAAAAVKEYSSLDPLGRGAVQPPHLDLIRDNAIKQRFLEVAEHDFGKFKAPMYQLWMQVELTPKLGEQLAAPWRSAASEARLRTLSGWSIWTTGVFALLAFAMRLDSAWNGRRRAAVFGTAAALTLGSLAILV